MGHWAKEALLVVGLPFKFYILVQLLLLMDICRHKLEEIDKVELRSTLKSYVYLVAVVGVVIPLGNINMCIDTVFSFFLHQCSRFHQARGTQRLT